MLAYFTKLKKPITIVYFKKYLLSICVFTYSAWHWNIC